MEIIRTSDRQYFKRCRVLWDFTSKIRQNYEPIERIEALDFGTAMHSAMEAYYDPKTWGDKVVMETNSMAAFLIAIKEVQQKVRIGALDFEIRFEELKALGIGMLEHYFLWAPKRDQFRPILVEIEFEVPIPGMNGEVVYQGRIDLVVEDEQGRYWLVDHKTTAQMADTEWLALDDQCSSYAWAIKQQLGLNVSGVIYNELRKKAPRIPPVLKNGRLSVNKSIDTTYEMYLEEVQRKGFKVEEYAGVLEYLKESPKEFVRRTRVTYGPRVLPIVEQRIQAEAREMLAWGKPEPVAIYPTPSRFNCNGCNFFRPCLALLEGYDPQSILDELYERRPTSA